MKQIIAILLIIFTVSLPAQHIGWKGKQVIGHFETRGGQPDLIAYRCPAGLWTIGYGHHDNTIRPGMQITTQKADAILAQDLFKFEDAANRQLKVTLSSNQYDGFLCYVFNRGSFYSPILDGINTGNIKGAAQIQLTRVTDIHNVAWEGLRIRRGTEYYLIINDTLLYQKYKGELR